MQWYMSGFCLHLSVLKNPDIYVLRIYIPTQRPHTGRREYKYTHTAIQVQQGSLCNNTIEHSQKSEGDPDSEEKVCYFCIRHYRLKVLLDAKATCRRCCFVEIPSL